MYTITNYLYEVNTTNLDASNTFVLESRPDVPIPFRLPNKCVTMELNGRNGNILSRKL